MQQTRLNPTPDQTYELVGEDFAKILTHARELAAAGNVEAACNERFAAVRRLTALLPENEPVNLAWNHANNRSALELLYASAVDHFLIDDFEMSAALLELLLETDPEDHLEASELLAFDYVALDERELFDEVINDISDKKANHQILLLWSAFRCDGKLPAGELQHFRTHFAPCFAEFTADEHPAGEAYLRDIENEHPSKAAQARELWLQTENLWTRCPDFIAALRTAK